MKYMLKKIGLLAIILFGTFNSFSQQTATEWYNKGVDLADDKKYEEAVTALTTATRLNPKYTDALYELGWCYNELEQYNDAINTLTKVVALKSDHHKAYHELGYAYKKKELYPEALKNLKKAIELKSDYALAFRDQGDVYRRMGNYESAMQSYKKCIEYDSNDDDALYELGYLSNEKGEYDKAVTWLERALAIEKEENAYNELGYAYYKLNKGPEAVETYNYSIDLNAEQSVAYKGLGDVYRINFSPARVADAKTNYQKAVQYNPKSSGSHYGLGWCYNEDGKYDEAITELKKATELDPSYSSAFMEYGYALYMKGRNDDALDKLGSAIRLNSKSKLAHYYSGLCYIQLKDKSNAMKMYNALKNIDEAQANKLMERINKM